MRTRATLGQVSSILSSLTSTAEDQATQQAEAYAYSLYDEYQVQIWLSGIALITWMLWVSTRDTAQSAKG